MIKYEKYWLSRIISVQAVVSADYIEGCFPARNNHFHQDAWELVFVNRGTASVRKGKKMVALTEKQLILVQPGVNHDLQIDDPGAKTFVLAFVCSNDSYLFSLQNTVLQAAPTMLPMVEAMIRELTDTFAPPDRKAAPFPVCAGCQLSRGRGADDLLLLRAVFDFAPPGDHQSPGQCGVL